MLQNIAISISQSELKKHLYLFGLAIVSVLLIGYQYGTFDQAIHIPFLKAFSDPTLYPNDAFVELRHAHYSYFWFLFLPFYEWGILEEMLFAVHILVTYFTFLMFYQLSDTLFKNPLSSMLGTLAFVVPHASFAGFPVIEFSLLNRTFVMPFLLLAINLYLRGIRARAFFMLGILYNLHVLSVHFILAMFILDFVLEYKKVGWLKTLNCVVVFALSALPVLLWKAQDSSGTEIQLEPFWFELINRTMLTHLFNLTGNYYSFLAGLSALSAYVLFIFAYRSAPPRPHDRTVMVFVLATALVVLAQVIVTAWLPISIIVQLQIIRAGIFGVIFAYLYFADYLARKFGAEGKPSPGDGVMLFTFLASILTFITLLVLAGKKWWAATALRARITGVALALGFAVSLLISLGLGVWHPGIYIFGRQTEWRDVQEWAKANTPKDAVFITPLNKWWLDESEWRVFSERQNVVALSEILEVAFEPQYLERWIPRFNALAPGALEEFRGDYPQNREITGRMYNALPTQALVDAACEYKASYLVVEKPVLHTLPQLYENAEYRVYDLTGIACP